MGLIRMPKFLRRFIRRVMNPVNYNKAWTTREKISLVYAVIAWHALALVGYQIYMGNKHWPVTLGVHTGDKGDIRPAIQYSHLLGVKKAQVYRISGFNISSPDYIAIHDEERQVQGDPAPESNPEQSSSSSSDENYTFMKD